jgi:hypothetical protein
MKWAPIATLATLGALFVAVATAHSDKPAITVRTLPVRGIDTLVVDAPKDMVKITVALGQPATVQYLTSEVAKVTVEQRGSQLLVASNLEGYLELKIVVPPSVRVFVVDHVAIAVEGPRMGAVTIQARREVNWQGDAERLEIVDTDPHRLCAKKCNRFGATVESGDVGMLQVRSENASVILAEPDHIGTAELDIGADGEVDIHNASSLDHFHIVRPGAVP